MCLSPCIVDTCTLSSLHQEMATEEAAAIRSGRKPVPRFQAANERQQRPVRAKVSRGECWVVGGGRRVWCFSWGCIMLFLRQAAVHWHAPRCTLLPVAHAPAWRRAAVSGAAALAGPAASGR